MPHARMVLNKVLLDKVTGDAKDLTYEDIDLSMNNVGLLIRWVRGVEPQEDLRYDAFKPKRAPEHLRSGRLAD